MEVTKDYLKKLCRDTGGYGVPELNDRLYLHYKGIKSICNLEEYVALRVIWLEGNGLAKIEGLDQLKELRTLYLHENIIDKIENLDQLLFLDTINLSKNYIRRIENLAHLHTLKTLILSNNNLKTAEDIHHVLEIPSLETLDIQHNRIEDPGVVQIFTKMPNLKVLYLQGNPVVKEIRHYRKTIVSGCRELRYLDDRPVFEDERRRTDAWSVGFKEGGTLEAANEAERAEIKLIREEKEQAERRNFLAMEQMMREGYEVRLMREEENRQRTIEGADSLPPPPEVNPFSNEPIIKIQDSEVVRSYRQEQMERIMSGPPPNPDALKPRLKQEKQQNETQPTETPQQEPGEVDALPPPPIPKWSQNFPPQPPPDVNE